MTKATHPLANRIALVFDFDDTLVPDSFDSLLEHCGFDSQTFRQQRIEPLINNGWEPMLARFYSLIQESKQREGKDKITKDSIIQLGQGLTPFTGVPEMFGRLRQRAKAIVADIDVEFYLITSGMVEVARHTCIAHEFNAMWGCEFHYGESGEIEFMKRLVSHTEKTRYLFGLARGINGQNQDGQMFVYRDIPPEELYVPLTQVIYIGDGTSDIPCFSVMNEEKGVAIGVYKGRTAQEWTHELRLSTTQRVVNLAPAEYSEDSELMQSLTLAVESMCKQIALHKLSVGE